MAVTPDALTATLPTGTGPFPGLARPAIAPSFRRRQHCLRLPMPAADEELDLIRNQVIMLLLDDSGSMFHPEADQEGIRYIAAESVVSLLRQIGVLALGIIHWGSFCPADLLLRPTTPRDIRRVDIALRMPKSSLGGTNLPRALRFAHSIVQEDVPNLAPSYLVITDGLESIGRPLEEALAELPPRSVRLLLVDRAERCEGPIEQQWRKLPLGAFIRLNASDPDDWAWAAGIALFSDLKTPYPELPDPTKRKYLR